MDTVLQGAEARVATLNGGRPFFRAQVAHHDEHDEEAGATIPGPAFPDRMTPFSDRASEGRVNPKGIPCLYLGSDRHTALAECRPWIGSLVTISVFRTVRDLKIVDCTRNAHKSFFYFDREPSPKKREEAVWSHIARAFREPVTRDDNRADYAPTQVVAESFRAAGFDGVAYRSAFGTDKFNLALFDLGAASLQMSELHEVKDIHFAHDQAANPYFVKERDEGKKQIVRNVMVEVRPLKG
ncbi:RES family NAD+ phosphorylase [Mesorhizobium australicum]|uniref:RES family NAD+ phosphorylase n=1 Tax=Mesorhizobium australicum TaxID=536018 RepID=UPI003336F6F9